MASLYNRLYRRGMPVEMALSELENSAGKQFDPDGFRRSPWFDITGTDYIDIYQLHWPDRPMRIFEGLEYVRLPGDTHPIHDILATLGQLVAGGKVSRG